MARTWLNGSRAVATPDFRAQFALLVTNLVYHQQARSSMTCCCRLTSSYAQVRLPQDAFDHVLSALVNVLSQSAASADDVAGHVLRAIGALAYDDGSRCAKVAILTAAC